MIPAGFVFLALAFNVLGAGSYLYRLARREIQPHIVTWALWALAPLVAFVAQLSEHIGVQSLITLFTGASPLVVVVMLIARRQGAWGVTACDLFCGALSVAGLIIWALTRHAAYAVLFAIAADALAAVPTYRKAWRNPGSESWFNFACLAVSALITLATITTWSPAHYAFAAYLAVLGLSMTAVILLGNRRVAAGRRA
ncbi:hypothetical protein [Paractinoplanes toevensis]|uniref:Uncharacterized protein n=1 Tax=Paractinoplanes toevensis TaxID=571911 RepID=A0A920BQD0_9ACTN|nr:hypothetical protein [Actinoplanes toevensis]GIM96586.1 hypothetical protein Ato02nite_083790 [Actinoplanes toevensis]